MSTYTFLYKEILPSIFKLQDKIWLLSWIPILGDLVKIKLRAINYLNLQRGDTVLVYSIGAGFELDSIINKIGKEGFVVGVDFSREMLNIAQEKVNKNNWKNVNLVLADVKTFDPIKKADKKFDAALSNFGYLDNAVLYALLNAVKRGGRIAISSPQPLKGFKVIFYPITFVPEMLFGLTWKKLKTVPEFIEILKKETHDPIIDEKTFANYFVAVVGTK